MDLKSNNCIRHYKDFANLAIKTRLDMRVCVGGGTNFGVLLID